MPVSVPLEFIPPSEPGLAKLHIWESNNPTTGFTEIDMTTAVGTYPVYINRFTTDNASSLTGWFAIQWEDVDGVTSELSAPVQGGTKTLVGVIVERVMLRVPSLSEEIVAEEAEAWIWRFKKVDPYTLLDDDVTPTQLKALTDLTLVNSMYPQVITQAFESSGYTAGLVSETKGANSSTNSLQALKAFEIRALGILGIGGSLIGQLDDRSSCLTLTGQKTVLDHSRLLAVSAIITEEMVEREIT